MTPEETIKWLENKQAKFNGHLELLLPSLSAETDHEHAKETVEAGGNSFIRRLHLLIHETNPCMALNGEIETTKAIIQHFEWRISQIEMEKEHLKCQ